MGFLVFGEPREAAFQAIEAFSEPRGHGARAITLVNFNIRDSAQTISPLIVIHINIAHRRGLIFAWRSLEVNGISLDVVVGLWNNLPSGLNVGDIIICSGLRSVGGQPGDP